jgi:trehalose/maltose hydrolase-like predicted phosphorylase
MLFYLFSPEELARLFGRLGYRYDADLPRRTIEYYDARTSHGSTLSFITHAAAFASLDPETSWERFLFALRSDVDDVQGGTTKEGIHLGVMAGTLDLVQRTYAGVRIRDEVLCFDPVLTDRLDRVSFQIQFRGTPIRVEFDRGRLTLSVHPEGVTPQIKVAVRGEPWKLNAGDRRTFDLRPRELTAVLAGETAMTNGASHGDEGTGA